MTSSLPRLRGFNEAAAMMLRKTLEILSDHRRHWSSRFNEAAAMMLRKTAQHMADQTIVRMKLQ